MGTRHSTLVQLGGEYRIAQYGQWDGYPECTGSIILAALRALDLDDFKAKVASLKSLSDEDIRARWKEVGRDDFDQPAPLEVSNAFFARWPHLSRDCGGDIIASVANGRATDVVLGTSFVADSLWCEWAYVIDLDKNVFEVHRGFNQNALSESDRFHSLGGPSESGYYPVRMVASWPLDALPPTDEAFLAAFAEAG